MKYSILSITQTSLSKTALMYLSQIKFRTDMFHTFLFLLVRSLVITRIDYITAFNFALTRTLGYIPDGIVNEMEYRLYT